MDKSATRTSVMQALLGRGRFASPDLTTSRFIPTAYVLPPVAGILGLIWLTTVSMQASLVLLATILGWTVVVGPCGRAHTCALTPAGCVKGFPGGWLAGIVAYSIGGSISAALIGVALAIVGKTIDPGGWAIGALSIVGTLCVLRELRVINIPLVELQRQTRARWFTNGPLFLNPLLWGLDVGLVFATWITFSGAWFLAIAVLLSGDAALGVMVFIAYWIGRSLPHWMEPQLQRNPVSTISAMQAMVSQSGRLQLCHALALSVFVLATVLR